VDNFFSLFAGQFPCSTKDSSDPPLPQDIRFPIPKDQCPWVALTAAKYAQPTTPQRWVSSTSLMHLKGSLNSNRKSAVLLHISLSKHSAARLLLRPDP